jgi:hypothetical protein
MKGCLCDLLAAYMSVARQQFGKYYPVAMNTRATLEKSVERDVFCVVCVVSNISLGKNKNIPMGPGAMLNQDCAGEVSSNLPDRLTAHNLLFIFFSPRTKISWAGD